MNSLSRVTLRDVLSKPLSTPATPIERRVTEHLVQWLLDESPEEVIKVPTRGQVSCNIFFVQANVHVTYVCTTTYTHWNH